MRKTIKYNGGTHKNWKPKFIKEELKEIEEMKKDDPDWESEKMDRNEIGMSQEE